MTYHFTKTVDMSFDDAVMSTKEALKRHNFRVLTEIDMKDNFKKGLNVDFRPYLILGACNPELSYRALQAEDKIGTMLPCNVVLQQQEGGRVEVSAIVGVGPVGPTTRLWSLNCGCVGTCPCSWHPQGIGAPRTAPSADPLTPPQSIIWRRRSRRGVRRELRPTGVNRRQPAQKSGADGDPISRPEHECSRFAPVAVNQPSTQDTQRSTRRSQNGPFTQFRAASRDEMPP